MCNRPMGKAAATIASRNGPMGFGPECARRAGLTFTAAKKRAALVAIRGRSARQDSQLDLFEVTP